MAKPEIKPVWSSSSFLVYTGGLTVLGGAISAISYLSGQYGHAARAGWALLILVVLYVVAHALRRRERPIAAGIFAFASVIAWAVFVYYLFRWWGWNGVTGCTSHDIHEWSWSRMLFWILVLAAASDDRRRFRFPFIRAISAVVFWAFLLDLLSSGSGDWATTLSLLVGLFYLLVGKVTDKPSAFWLHLVAGALIGGAFLEWFHSGDGEFAIICIVALVFVLIAHAMHRSSWAVYGTIGFFLATVHYIGFSLSPAPLLNLGSGVPRSPQDVQSFFAFSSPWAPALAFGLLGFWLVALGMLGKRKRAHTHTTVVVGTPAPPAA